MKSTPMNFAPGLLAALLAASGAGFRRVAGDALGGDDAKARIGGYRNRAGWSNARWKRAALKARRRDAHRRACKGRR